MRRYISLVLMLVAMLLLTTSIVGAESQGMFNSKPGCGTESPGNGKGKAKGTNKNCTNETNETNETEFNTEGQGFEGSPSAAPASTVPDWSSVAESGSPSQDSSFAADTSTVSAAPDCFSDDGEGLNRGAIQRCENGATSYTDIDIDAYFVEARLSCSGDLVTVSGNFLFLTHTTIDGNGRYHTKILFSPMNVSGFGWPSGTIYRGTGVTQRQNEGIVGAPQTFINNFRLISQGSAPNLMIHMNTHTTVNANGDVTSTVDHTTINCM